MLKLPTEDEVRLEGFLPSSQFPSDHLSLYATFALAAAPPAAPGGAAAAAVAAGGLPTFKRLGGGAGAAMMPTIHSGGPTLLLTSQMVHARHSDGADHPLAWQGQRGR